MENEDDRLTRLLREKGEGYIMDDGFTSRVMERLPARRPRTSRVVRAVVAGSLAACGAATLAVVAQSVPGLWETVEKLARSNGEVRADLWSPYVYVAASLVACAALSVWALRSDER